MDCIVTTSTKADPHSMALAQGLAQQLAVPLVPRGKQSLEKIRQTWGVAQILVCSSAGPILDTPTGKFFFHPSMAKLRIKSLRRGRTDPMVQAMNLRPGQKVLDCTLGLGADALVSSYVVGSTGQVLGLEINPVTALLVAYGTRYFESPERELVDAVRRVQVVNGDYRDYLAGLAPNSFDVVYFDPMFRVPVHSSTGISPLRSLADHRPVDSQTVAMACQVARNRVVMKERADGAELERLGFTFLSSSKSSRVAYGYRTTGEGQG